MKKMEKKIISVLFCIARGLENRALWVFNDWTIEIEVERFISEGFGLTNQNGINRDKILSTDSDGETLPYSSVLRKGT